VIQARREIVFGFFTESARWASWWGAGSTIDARPGGRVVIRYPDATEAWGEVTEIVVPERIAFTYGYASGHPIPPGGSRVTIRLEAENSHTRLHLRHAFDDSERDAAVREATLVRVVAPVVRFRDRFSLIDGIADLIVHLDAAQRFMPGIRLQHRIHSVASAPPRPCLDRTSWTVF
jgi:uncharacterized protein YndB with AHSA1/START domain